MRLTDLNQKPVKIATKALRENYDFEMAVERMNSYKTSVMLKKVRDLLAESQGSSMDMQGKMKLKFMEQALSAHLADLRRARPQIVFENEEVDKSESVLAAQAMVNAVQKMIEQVSDMVVKELPALGDSIESDIGVNEGQQFTQQVGDALRALQDALTQGRDALSGAVDTITGQGGGELAQPDMGGEDIGGEELPEPEGDMGGEPAGGEMPEMPAEPEEPEEPEAAVGRERR